MVEHLYNPSANLYLLAVILIAVVRIRTHTSP